MKEKITINSEAINLRREFGEDANSPIDIFSLIHGYNDLTLVFYPMSNHVSGMCIRDRNNKIIGVNSNSTYGRQRYTIAHELYHLFYHKDFKSIFCSKDLEASKTMEEKEADMFASYFLAPYESLAFFVEKTIKKDSEQLELEDVVKIEQHYGLSRQATLWRLINDKHLAYDKVESMKTGIIASALKFGYDDRLYVPTPEYKQYAVYGKYINRIEILREKDLISTGKYEELILDGFRKDIVYGYVAEEKEKYE